MTSTQNQSRNAEGLFCFFRTQRTRFRNFALWTFSDGPLVWSVLFVSSQISAILVRSWSTQKTATKLSLTNLKITIYNVCTTNLPAHRLFKIILSFGHFQTDDLLSLLTLARAVQSMICPKYDALWKGSCSSREVENSTLQDLWGLRRDEREQTPILTHSSLRYSSLTGRDKCNFIGFFSRVISWSSSFATAASVFFCDVLPVAVFALPPSDWLKFSVHSYNMCIAGRQKVVEQVADVTPCVLLRAPQAHTVLSSCTGWDA